LNRSNIPRLLRNFSKNATLVTPKTILDSADGGYLGLVAWVVPFGDLDAPDESLDSGWGVNHRVLGLGEEFEFFTVHGASIFPL
jgi:hypothetical protein